MKAFEVTTTTLLLLVLLLVAYCAYVSTRVVVALQRVDERAEQAIGVGQGLINAARNIFRI